MSRFFVATPDELRLLTKAERNVYEMYRHEGKTKVDICILLAITPVTFKSHWSRAVNKIEKHRLLVESPLAFLKEIEQKEGRDIFKGNAGVLQAALEETESPVGAIFPSNEETR